MPTLLLLLIAGGIIYFFWNAARSAAERAVELGRNAFRAALKLAQLVNIELGGEKLKAPISGKLLDISATGCKLRFEGDISERLQLGQVYDRFIAALPFGSMTTSVELRYLHFEEKINTTFAGVRFHNMSGLVQRQVERFVYQLQREARRFDKDDDF